MKSEQKIVELIQREIDGLNSPEESAELQAIVAKDPQVRKIYDELRAVADTLEQAEQLEPPAHLKAAILSALPKRKEAPAASKGVLQWLAGFLPRQPRFQISLAFAGGLAAGLLLFALFASEALRQSPSDVADYYGTLVAPEKEADLTVLHELVIDIEQAQGRVVVKSAGSTFLIETDLVAQDEIRLIFDFDRARLHFSGFVVSQESDSGNVRFDDQRVALTAPLPPLAQLLFSKKNGEPSPVQFQIEKKGVLLYKSALPLSR